MSMCFSIFKEGQPTGASKSPHTSEAPSGGANELLALTTEISLESVAKPYLSTESSTHGWKGDSPKVVFAGSVAHTLNS